MNKRNLQVTFCKRGGGLFKKASELSTLCDVRPIEKMNIQQLSQFKSALEDIKKNVAHQCTNILIQNAMKKPNISSNPALPSRMLQTSMFQNFKLLQSDLGGGLY
ncbi:unnamed protein product [Lupinus luteus]|uniref:MADS-box domain-containing protein n=1 Tax=Lupinus luteus TaxID=3873 RepID=A0AAV1X8I5_LUPLU